MRIAIATVQVPFVRGGAELLAESLQAALVAAGHEAEIVTIPFKWYPAERIPQAILATRLLDVTESTGVPIDRVIGLKFPAYLVAHPHKVLWLLHQHRGAYDWWGTERSDLRDAPDGAQVRAVIEAADRELLPEYAARYTISANVTGRLRRFCGIESTPLYHPPPHAGDYREGAFGDYLLLPGRINETKRQALVVEALFHTRSPVRVVFLGQPDVPGGADAMMRRAAGLPGGGERAVWVGGVDAARKLELYAGCRGVIVPPFDEDYGYVTLEAMLAGKPVVTLTDAGGPLEFVVDGETGIVAAPEPLALAAALDRLWEEPALAARLGAAGAARYADLGIGWPRVLECLLA